MVTRKEEKARQNDVGLKPNLQLRLPNFSKGLSPLFIGCAAVIAREASAYRGNPVRLIIGSIFWISPFCTVDFRIASAAIALPRNDVQLFNEFPAFAMTLHSDWVLIKSLNWYNKLHLTVFIILSHITRLADLHIVYLAIYIMLFYSYFKYELQININTRIEL